MNITKMNVQELKAVAYDLIAEIERMQNNLRLVNQEIAKKSEKKVEKPVDTDPTSPSEDKAA